MLFYEAEKILKSHKKDLSILGANALAVFGSIVKKRRQEE